MPIAYVTLAGRGATDACIAAAVARLRAGGARLAGTVQVESAGASDPLRCDMDLAVLPDGPVFRISQTLGKGARGCRLDGGALEQAVTEVAPRMAGAEVLVVNKFGKLEAQGHGFVPLIVQAMDCGMPVLIGVNGLNQADLVAFCDGLADALAPDPKAIADWVQTAIAQRR